MKKFVSFLLAVSIMTSMICLAEGRNIIEFCQVYMNRVDTCYDAMDGVYLDFEIPDIKSSILSKDGDEMEISCLAGKATVNLKNMEIDELSMTPLQGKINDDVHDVWALKTIIAISVLEFDSYEHQRIKESGEYGGSVEKAVAIWNEFFKTDGISKAIAEKKDVLVYSGENYDYWAHYGYYPTEYACYIAKKKEKDTITSIVQSIKNQDKAEMDTFSISPGKYTVGEDIPVGVYRCECKGAYSSAILKVYKTKEAKWPIVNEIMAELYGSSVVGKLELEKGNILEISMGTVDFSPYTGKMK